MLVALRRLGRQRTTLLAIWALAILGCAIGLAVPISTAPLGALAQALELVRALTTVALVLTLLLGPGLILRGLTGRDVALGFLPVAGLLLLVATSSVAWFLATTVSPRLVYVVVLVPVLGLLLVGLFRCESEALLDPEEARVLLIIGVAFGIAVARTLWSPGPRGELLGGVSWRTFEVGDRSDARVPYAIAQLIRYGTSPFSPYVKYYFGGYTFSDRGPVAGLASAPFVFLTGGKPPFGTAPAGPWFPFDANGVESYRIGMMALASTAFSSVWSLTRRLAGPGTARLALLLAITTPFVVHDVWFTWAKLLAGSLVLLSATSLIGGRPFLAGLLLGLGYLAHPIALFSVPILILIALSPSIARDGASWGPRLRTAVSLVGGIALYLIAWRLINGSHYTEGNFLQYAGQAGANTALHQAQLRQLGLHAPSVTLGQWIDFRLVSLGNTLVPLRLFLLSANDQGINSALQPCFPLCHGGSPAIVHFYFQYWTTVPFGFGIVFFPLLITSLWRALRMWPWTIAAVVLLPFAMFTVYWGPTSTGMLREGLHAWVLTLVVVVACEQRASGFPWLRNAWIRGVLALRSLEVLLMATLPSIVTTHRIYAHAFRYTDAAALVLLFVLCGVAGGLLLGERAPPATRSETPAHGSLAAG